MAVRRRVRCVTRDDDGDITHIGNTAVWGKRTVAEAIKDIQGATYSYYVKEDGHSSDVIAVPKDNPTYLRTTPDGHDENNLDNLDDC